MLSYAIHLIFRVIYLIILLVVFLSWIPIFDINKEPIATLIKIYNVIMRPFKSIIPPIGMIDITPIVAFFVLQLAEQVITKILGSVGL